MVTIVNNNVYMKFTKRLDLKCSQHKKVNMLGNGYVN